jgi:hypothetical protein
MKPVNGNWNMETGNWKPQTGKWKLEDRNLMAVGAWF